MSVMSQCNSVIIDLGINVPGNSILVVDELSDVDNCYIYQLMSNVKITVTNRFDSHLQIYTSNQNNDVGLAK